jgi:PAS domain S-box-containing protein
MEREQHATTPTKIHSSELFFRALVESAPDGIVISDPDGHIVLVNAQTEALFGYRRDELEGRPVETLVPERFRAQHPGLRHGFTVAPQTRPMGAGLELFGQRKDGSEFPVQISLSPIQTEDGLNIFSAIRDITQQREAEHRIQELNLRLSRQNAELQSVNQELEAFSYSVSHDLRAPLRAIDGFSRILLQDHAEKFDASADNLLQRVRRAAQQMGSLIDDLLKLSRVARTELQFDVLDLALLAGEAAEALRQQASERSVQFINARRLMVRGDARLLRIALDNLLGNAWKFSGQRDDARVEFGMRVENGENIYFVADNGAGFDMAYADKLFGAFQRLHDTHEFPGTGIGLATAQRIIHKHGGRIWADAAVDAGARFMFTLPGQETFG